MEEHDKREGVVLQLVRPELGREPPIVKKAVPGREFCRHVHSAFDDNARRIWCRDCKAELDPFDVIAAVSAASDFSWAADEKARLENDVNKLRRELAKLRGQVSRERRKGEQG